MGQTRPTAPCEDCLLQRLCSVELNPKQERVESPAEVWDSGIYTLGQILGIPTKFLVDTGAAVSILSQDMYRKIPSHKRPAFQETDIIVRGVSGNQLEVTGVAQVPVVFQGALFMQDFLIADIPLEAILGQDMLMKNQGRLDLGRLTLRLKGTDLPCWTQGEENVSCRVIVKEMAHIPYQAERFVPVTITNPGYLPEAGFVQPAAEVVESKEVMMVRGIVPTREEVAYVRVLNLSENDLDLHPNQYVGTCEPYVDKPPPSRVEVAGTTTNTAEPDGEIVLPQHLEELLKDSSRELSADERQELKMLLWKYRQVFAKDNKDMGCCPFIKHRINTGTALPIRKPPRRLPLGKREIEHQEIHAMLDKGIIQPSTSPWSSPIVLVSKKDGSTRFCIDEDKGDELPIA